MTQLSDQEICTRYQAGETGPALAKATGVSTTRIYKALRAAGIPIASVGLRRGSKIEHTLTFAQRDALIADLRAVTLPTLAAIAKKYGTTRENIRQHAAAANITYYTNAARRARTAARKAQVAAARAQRKAARLDALEALWKAGASSAEIYEKLGIANATLRIVAFRKLYPDRFPYRQPKSSPLARAQKAAEIAEKRAACQQRHALLETLWNAGTPIRDIARLTGLRSPYGTVDQLRKRFPDRFPRR